MAYFKWLLGGLVGAGIGGIVWVLLGYYANVEVGYIAWGIGLLAGLGVRVLADSEHGIGPGIAAVTTATLVICVSKYVVISMLLSNSLQTDLLRSNFTLSEEEEVALIASEIAQSQEEAGTAVKWPKGMTLEDAFLKADFPASIWKEALAVRRKQTPEERAKMLQDRREAIDAIIDEMVPAMRQDLFFAQFGIFDLLWFGLAAFTAFRVGSGADN
ncbi:hypothetical protein SH668x_003253 [Planctomicrobium sp. SH668]|uniref:hypothetical protein n=1 Tax=Planctomicrobium sp. SH668 TaxID=3448126 RepID=UPI003F5B0788